MKQVATRVGDLCLRGTRADMMTLTLIVGDDRSGTKIEAMSMYRIFQSAVIKSEFDRRMFTGYGLLPMKIVR